MAFRLSDTRRLIVEGVLFIGARELHFGVASSAACWSMRVNLEIAGFEFSITVHLVAYFRFIVLPIYAL